MSKTPTPAEIRAESERILSEELLHQSKLLVKSLRKDDAPADEPPPEGLEDDAPPAGDEPPAEEAAPSSETPPPAEEDAGSWTVDEAIEALRAMPPEQLAIWQQAIEQVASGQGDDMGTGAEEAPPADEPPMEAMKSELAKMERRLEQMIQVQVTALAKSMPAQKPQRRAATAPAAVAPRQAQLSKAEIERRLAVKVRDPRLTKDDRDAINAYSFGRTNADSIRHLLKD